METQVQTILSELRELLEACYGARLKRLVLFGSQARGDAEPGSDIDVLVVLAGPVDSTEEYKRTRDMLYDLMYAHEYILISCTFMDEERFTTRNGPLLRNIRREGIAV
ncbi:MAG: nucleotidyltransferase domain-containing protein [Chloroflexota bacterium]|nr:nucleotidyltransferase domain-containing protein [Chloroflexota bacterium]